MTTFPFSPPPSPPPPQSQQECEEEVLLVGYDGLGSVFVDRDAAGADDFSDAFSSANLTVAPYPTNADGDGSTAVRLSLWLDTSGAECFFSDGALAVATSFFPEGAYVAAGIRVGQDGDDGDVVLSGRICSVGSVWI